MKNRADPGDSMSKKIPEEKFEDLVQAVRKVRRRTFNGVCQITLLNGCPADWNVVIVAAGVKFFYAQGGDFTDGPRDVNLYSGQSATFVSGDPAECVQGYALAATVATPDGAQNMPYTDSAPQGQCLIHETVTLGPQRSVPVSDKRNIGSVLEIRKG